MEAVLAHSVMNALEEHGGVRSGRKRYEKIYQLTLRFWMI
jgi:hypothetical protein